MSDSPIRSKIFLAGQGLSELKGCPLKDRQYHVCGGKPGAETKREAPEDYWTPIGRETLSREARAAKPIRHRAALVCDAGRGKSTNLQWLQYQLCHKESQQLVFLLDLASSVHVEVLKSEKTILEWALRELRTANQTEYTDHQYSDIIHRRQHDGRISFLIDGLDHAISDTVLDQLSTWMTSAKWRDCHFWIAGRPYAFDQAWMSLFRGPEWAFLRVEELEEPDIRYYLDKTSGGDWFELIPEAGRNLLANPRLLRLMSGLLLGAVEEADLANPTAMGEERIRLRKAAIEELELRTGADVYSRAYFELGRYPERHISGQDDEALRDHRRGLLASGVLKGTASFIGLKRGDTPDRNNYQRRIHRAAALLGAIAFQMFAQNTIRPKNEGEKPHPNLVGVPETEFDPFLEAVEDRVKSTDPRQKCSFGDDFARLQEMNTQAVDFLLFKNLNLKGIAWHDPTVQAFFAAYWVVKYGEKDERDIIQKWIVFQDKQAKAPVRLTAFNEFWRFAAQMPDGFIDEPRWVEAFENCYAREKTKAALPDGHLQFTREMIYHSHHRMERRSSQVFNSWRADWLSLETAVKKPRCSAERKKLYQELAGAESYRDCPPKGEPVGEIPRFKMNVFTVTNLQYELFEPFHKRQKTISDHDDQPVVSVGFWDSYCFAVWIGKRLPTEWEWEFACRAGTTTEYWFGDRNNGTRANCDGGHPDGTDDKGPFLKRTVRMAEHRIPGYSEIHYEHNPWGLWHMHGNVSEWCNSMHSNDYRTVRGGSWDDVAGFCRVSYRSRYGPDYRSHYCGFRLACLDFG